MIRQLNANGTQSKIQNPKSKIEMIRRLHTNITRFCSRWRTVAFSVGLLLMSLVAFAQGDHEHEHDAPLDPQVQAFQLRFYGFVGLCVILFLVWYWLRWWQIRHGPSVRPSEDDQAD